MNAVSYQVREGALWIAGARVDLPCEVGEVLEIEGLVVVLVEPPIGEVLNRNVYAYTKQGLLAWQIEESPHGTELDKPFIGISVNTGNSGELIAANWNGVDYSVSLKDGSIAVKAFSK